MTTQLGVFAKYWLPGAVKTRLAATIGAEPASRVYLAGLTTTLQRFSSTADRRVLEIWPPEEQPAFDQLAGGDWEVRPQISGDLGQKMEHYFRVSLESGAERVALIGSDSPTMPAEYLEQTWELLKRFPVVLGPSEDGGYYLVAAAENVPPIFSGIAWSSPQVWEQTVEKLRAANIPFGVAPTWWDVDEYQDLQRLRRELETETLAPPLEKLRAEIRRLA